MAAISIAGSGIDRAEGFAASTTAAVVCALEDAHRHIVGLSPGLVKVNVHDYRSARESGTHVYPAVPVPPPGVWVQCRDWDQDLLGRVLQVGGLSYP
jgi:hypothetical protein